MIIHNLAHSYIPTMWYILGGYAVSAVILCFVDVEQGMKDIGKGDSTVTTDEEKDKCQAEAVAGSS